MAMSHDNQWWRYKPIVTVTDAIEAGACLDGVVVWLARHDGMISGVAKEYPGWSPIQNAANTSPSLDSLESSSGGGLNPFAPHTECHHNRCFGLGGSIGDLRPRDFEVEPLATHEPCLYDEDDGYVYGDDLAI
jgi:hypothetical protein